MKSSPTALLCFPGEEAREYWRQGRDQTWTRLERRPMDRTGCLFAMESLALDSLPIWAVRPEEGTTDVRSVAALRWAARDATLNDDLSWSSWEVAHETSRTLAGTAGMAVDPPVSEWLRSHPQTFEPSARCLPLPDHGLAVWRELGRYAVAVSVATQPAHFATLASTCLDHSAANEIRDLLLCLRASEIPLTLDEARLWTPAEPGFAEQLLQTTGLAIVVEDRPAPRPPGSPTCLRPPSFARVWRQRAVSRRRFLALGTLVALYFLGFSGWAAALTWQSRSLDLREAKITTVRPQLQSVQAAQDRWLAVEKAVDPDAYVPEVFHRVVSLLPAEGIRLKEFGLDREKLVLAGEASTVAHAKQFQSDVIGSAELRQFNWNFPQPTILDDNRASFRAEGLTRKGGRTHETR